MSDIKLTKRQVWLVLFAIWSVGLILRLLYLDRITFGYDQARDAFEAIDIWTRDPIKIIGPTTDIAGLFHGVLYFYLISPFYYFSQGDPMIVRGFLILINLLNVFFIFYLAKQMFRRNLLALGCAFMFAISFDAIQYGRWLSNPPPALITVALFYYGMWLILNKKISGFPLMLLAWSISVNFQFFLVYQAMFLLIIFIYLMIKDREKLLLTFKNNLVYYILSVFFLSPYIAVQLKFKFHGLRALFGFLSGAKGSNILILDKLINFFNKLIINISYNITVGNIVLAKIIFIFLFIWLILIVRNEIRYQKQLLFLFFWLMSSMIIYPLEKNNSYFLNIGNIYPLILLIVFAIYKISEKFSKFRFIFIIFLLSFILTGNLYLINLYNGRGEVIFSVQDGQILNNEKKVIDYIYKESKKKNFAINSVTNPLFINTAWTYLFNWYGNQKYNYMPVWLGYPQEGTFGSHIKYIEERNKKGLLLFLIIEPGPGIPESYIKAYSKFENTRSRLVEIRKFGTFTVEKREITEDKPFLRDELNKYL